MIVALNLFMSEISGTLNAAKLKEQKNCNSSQNMTSANEIIKEFDSEESENKIRITNVIINANVTNDENLRYDVD